MKHRVCTVGMSAAFGVCVILGTWAAPEVSAAPGMRVAPGTSAAPEISAAPGIPGSPGLSSSAGICVSPHPDAARTGDGWNADPLAYRFTGLYGQVEVGGRFAGAEFHHSRPLPSRLSFFYPVANSVDLSTDYWKRAESQPLRVGVRINGKPVQWLGTEPWIYVLSPHTVTYHHESTELSCTMSYAFGLEEPVLVFRFTVLNSAAERRLIEPVVELSAVLRSCQTYARFDRPAISCDSAAGVITARFTEPQTAGTSIFIQTVEGEGPRAVLPPQNPENTARFGFRYERYLDSRDSITITLLIGTCRNSETATTTQRLKGSWAADVAAYDHYVRSKAAHAAVLKTGDVWVDRTIPWAHALLAANAHYLDGAIVPMPCPAEYNFFFTHDMLLTDLAATACDPERVKRDLSYIASRAKDSVIPHAYYWKDDGFKTEYCAPDNWNHLWFVLVSGSYLRHTGDTVLGRRLYPLLLKSIHSALLRLNDDHLMYAQAPDWWDIGRNEGPRTYMTALVIRALREFAFIGALLNASPSGLGRYEVMASSMERSLGDHLWDKQSQYLTNFNGSTKDPHIYMGSLLAPVFGLLDSARATQLVGTAGQHLMADGVGMRTVMPPDFHTDSMKSFFHFAGNEAGDPYLYANGGVWPHNNAWYTLALIATGRRDDAFRFFRTTMTLDGIARSPMGQPAFYEYRYSDPTSPGYGEIDKPSFLWAAGFTLLTGYRLLGMQENEWNVSFSGELPSAIDTGRCELEFGGRKEVTITGKGKGLSSFHADGREIPSLVVPLDIRETKRWTVCLGPPPQPYLERLNAQLRSATYDRKNRKLLLGVSSFAGHTVIAVVTATGRMRSASVDGKQIHTCTVGHSRTGGQTLKLQFAGTGSTQALVIRF
jgi:glycogen debranching enzyme